MITKTKKILHKLALASCFMTLAIAPLDLSIVMPSVVSEEPVISGLNPFYQTPIQTQVLDLDIRQNQPLILTVPPLPVGNQNLPAISLEMLTPPANGSYGYDPATTVLTYNPSQDYIGTDQIFFQACYSATQCVDVTMNITVEQLNNTNPLITLNRSIPNTQTVVESAVEAGKQVANFTINQQPANGTVTANETGQTVTYDPADTFVGQDEFNYTACYIPDDSCQSYRIIVDVTGTSNPVEPIITQQTLAQTTQQNTPVTIPLAQSTAEIISSDITTQPSNGSLSIDDTAQNVLYTPNQDYIGTDSSLVRVCYDNNTCVDYTITITVEGNDPIDPIDPVDPVINEETLTQTTQINSQLPISVAKASTVVTTITIDTSAENGALAESISTQEIIYTPNPDYLGGDTATVTVCYQDTSCTLFTLQIDVVGDQQVQTPPVANDDTIVLSVRDPLEIDILGNDTDSSGPVTFSSIIQPSALGNATFNTASGLLEYTPAATENNLEDSIEYEICNAFGCDSAVLTISYAIIPVEEAIVIANEDEVYSTSLEPIAIDVLANDVSLPGDNLNPATLAVISDPVNGTASVDTQTGLIIYTTTSNGLSDQFMYTVCDTLGVCSQAVVSVFFEITIPVDPGPTPTPQPTPNPDPTPITPPEEDLVTLPTTGGNAAPFQPNPQVLGAYDDGTLPRTGGRDIKELFASVSLVLLGLIGLINTFLPTDDYS